MEKFTPKEPPIEAIDLVQAYVQQGPASFRDLDMLRSLYDVCKELKTYGFTPNVDFRLDLRAKPGERVADKPYSNKLAQELWILVRKGVIDARWSFGTFALREEALSSQPKPKPIVSAVVKEHFADYKFEDII